MTSNSKDGIGTAIELFYSIHHRTRKSATTLDGPNNGPTDASKNRSLPKPDILVSAATATATVATVVESLPTGTVPSHTMLYLSERGRRRAIIYPTPRDQHVARLVQ